MVASLARLLAVQSAAALARVVTDMADCRCGRAMRSAGDFPATSHESAYQLAEAGKFSRFSVALVAI